MPVQMTRDDGGPEAFGLCEPREELTRPLDARTSGPVLGSVVPPERAATAHRKLES